MILDEITGLINKRMHRVLDVAKVAIPGNEQFEAYRKIILDEFGKCGLLKDLERLLTDEKEWKGAGRK